jgi:hypothetical protein
LQFLALKDKGFCSKTRGLGRCLTCLLLHYFGSVVRRAVAKAEFESSEAIGQTFCTHLPDVCCRRHVFRKRPLSNGVL